MRAASSIEVAKAFAKKLADHQRKAQRIVARPSTDPDSSSDSTTTGKEAAEMPHNKKSRF